MEENIHILLPKLVRIASSAKKQKPRDLVAYPYGGVFFHVGLVDVMWTIPGAQGHNPLSICLPAPPISVCGFYSHHCKVAAETEGITFTCTVKKEGERGTEK